MSEDSTYFPLDEDRFENLANNIFDRLFAFMGRHGVVDVTKRMANEETDSYELRVVLEFDDMEPHVPGGVLEDLPSLPVDIRPKDGDIVLLWRWG